MLDEEEVSELILELEAERYSAICNGDFEAFRSIAYPSLIYTHSNGVVDNLDSYLKKCLDGYYIYHHIDHPVANIKVLGDTVLVFGEMNGKIIAGGVEKMLKNKSLAIWTKSEGSWLLIAYQSTPY